MKLARVFQWYLFVNLTFVAGLISAQETDNQKEFSYDESSEIGPAHWGEIHEEWKTCNSGKMQSPIDIADERVQVASHLGRLKRNYKSGNATLVNRGHYMMIKWSNAGGGYIEINGTHFQLKQLHWHLPSEHTINGQKFDMEVHLLHQSNDNRTAVVGIMYKIGRPDFFLSMMKRPLKLMAESDEVEKEIGFIHAGLVKLGSRKYYRYMGSLTIPPCTQNVIWTIVDKVRTVSKEQVDMIRDVVHEEFQANARPVQSINDRYIYLYRPEDIND